MLLRKQVLAPTAMIVGVCQGVGLDCAQVLARHGFNLILVDSNSVCLDSVKNRLVDEYGIIVRTIDDDISQPGATENILEEFVMYRSFSDIPVQIDVLINNTNLSVNPSEESEWEDSFELFSLHPIELADLVKIVGKDMAKRGVGKIFQILSLHDPNSEPLQQIYHTTRALVEDLSAELAMDYSKDGVSVCVLLPEKTPQSIPLLLHAFIEN